MFKAVQYAFYIMKKKKNPHNGGDQYEILHGEGPVIIVKREYTIRFTKHVDCIK